MCLPHGGARERDPGKPTILQNALEPNAISFLICPVILSCFALACSNQKPLGEMLTDAGPDASSVDAGRDLSEVLFEPDHLVDVQIEMDPDDWDTIRNEGRRLVELFSGCPSEFQYTYVNATVTVDGESFEDVAVRKKGYLGSLSRVRPSLKLNFRRNVEGRAAWGMRRMTLNNDRQDSSHTHQCMTYQLFRDADSLAPRCNFARVSVNGQDLGIYSHLESIKKPFLARHFDDDDGNLYEGQLADFHPDTLDEFELKTNELENDRSDLDEAVAAMDVEDDDLLASLEQVLDMDAFLTHWVMEVITGHWDSYSGNQNNFYIYHDPTSDRFYFIPWGADGAFSTDHSFLPPDIPKSVYAWSWPTYRLYTDPSSRSKYHERLRSLLDEVWDEEKLLAEVDRIGELTGADEVSLEKQREIIRGRKPMILEELDGDGPDWRYRPKDTLPEDTCFPAFEISGEFDTTWGELSALALSPQSDFELKDAEIPASLPPYDLHTDEIRQPYAGVLASAGPEDGTNTDLAVGTPEIWVARLPQSGPTLTVLVLMFEPSLFGQRELSFHGLETFGAVVRSTGPGGDNVILGFIGDGGVTFDEVGTNAGDRIKGSFTGKFVPMVFDQMAN